MEEYIDMLKSHEEWLMVKVLAYAQQYEFTKYTSTLAEAWRLSISGLSNSLILAAQHYSGAVPELHPDDEYTADPISEFGIIEAQKHRQRGIKLGMFLALMKYYKESYIDLIDYAAKDEVQNSFYKKFTTRCFDRIEISFCLEWSSQGKDKLINELQDKNRTVTNEKNKYLTIFESSFVPMIFVDENFKIINLNRAASQLFTDFTIAGTLYYTDNRSNPSLIKLGQQLSGFAASHSTKTSFESYLETQKGNLLFHVKMDKMQDVSAKFNGTIIMLEDITERKIIERRLEEYTDNLKLLNKNKDQFMSILAHDLKSPFCSLIGYSDLLMSDIDGYDMSQIKNHVSIIHTVIHQTYKLLEELLLWSKSQQGILQYEPQKIVFSAVCSEIIASLQDKSDEKAINISLVQSGETLLWADLNMFKTIVRNLISNAIKFTFPNGQIRVTAETKEGHAVITVTDNGMGIDAETQKTIWDFSQLHSSPGTNNEKGTGFGLMLCKDFVEKHGQQIWMESELSKGCTFMFTMPLWQDQCLLC